MLLAVLLAAAGPAPDTPHRAPALQPLCRKPSSVPVWDHRKTPLIHPLGNEPPAQQIRAVLRTMPDGCVVPMVVRAEVGQINR
jgi:hypothetical protein|uniref:hypothetical protein n=1 Tax=uncultured Sphingomonas sp. TaxID=158754 RepID=UPI0035CC3ABE